MKPVHTILFVNLFRPSPEAALPNGWVAVFPELIVAGRMRVGKLNIDENSQTAERFNVRSIPTLLIFKAGREVDRIVGMQSKRDLLRRLDRLLTLGRER
jgi:thiol-disulfide isomerase/thioredoxin